MYRRIAWRLMPFLIISYVINAIDRTNISMAQLRMESDLGFTAEIYGIGVGIFYLGYVMFEVPSNVLLERVGIRKTLLRIMALWGIVSSCTMFVTTPTQFYIVRFLLGIAEAGFYPGVLLYITLWFPSAYRARITAMFMIGMPLASAIGSPLSGAIIVGMEGVAGLRGWQWMFLLEGLPAVFLGFAAIFILTDRPDDAQWLAPAEKAAIRVDLADDHGVQSPNGREGVGSLFRDPQFYMLAFVIFGAYALTGASLWTPLLLRDAGIASVAGIGFLSAAPPLVSIAAMYLFARRSDKMRERRWHFFATLLIGASALSLLAVLPLSPLLVIVLQTVAMCCSFAGGTLLTGIFAAFLPDRARAAGIALLTSTGASAAIVTPMAIGQLRVATGDFSIALVMLSVVVVVAALVFIMGIPKSRINERLAAAS
tara:strand:+ start:6295 stop:7572 length:1278 start_codon:yes stop_codon:yes gene_type:complete